MTGSGESSITGGEVTGSYTPSGESTFGAGIYAKRNVIDLSHVTVTGGEYTGESTTATGGHGLVVRTGESASVTLEGVTISGGDNLKGADGKGGYGIYNDRETSLTVTVTGTSDVTVKGGTGKDNPVQDGFNKTVTVTSDGFTGKLTLSGSKADDSITGGSGDDVLDGRAGNDTITGGAGNDTFVFNKGDSGITTDKADTITNFKQNGDTDTIKFTGMAAGSDTNFAKANAATTDFNNALAAVSTAMSGNSLIIYSFQWVAPVGRGDGRWQGHRLTVHRQQQR